MRRLICLLAMIIVTTVGASETQPGNGLKKLTSAEIKATFRGKQFTDGVHFSDLYAVDGTISGVTMGRKQNKKWSVAKDSLCITDSFGENCYSIRMKGSTVKLFTGSGVFLEGKLK